MNPPRKWTVSSVTAVLALVGIATHLLMRFALRSTDAHSRIPLLLVLLAGAVTLLLPLLRRLWSLRFGSDYLAGLSIVTSAILGEYLVGSIVILMLSGGAALEEFATRRASSVLDALARRLPQVAHRKTSSGLVEVQLGDVAVGDELAVFPHEICPVDGVVIRGHGKMNEAYLTGEPFEVSKTPGAQVISGAVNGETALEIRAEKRAVDSRYAKIMHVMQATEQQRPRLRRLGDRLGAWYTPLAVALALLAWVLSGDSGRFLAVLVVATPCPLLIAIPVAVIGAISLSARRGIIIKNPAVLEQIDRCRTLIFDKTGTLTYGKPHLAAVLPSRHLRRDDLLRLAANLERYSKHPLAPAVLAEAQALGLPLETVSEMSEKPGEGLRGVVDGKHVWITGRKAVRDLPEFPPPPAAGMECIVFVDGEFAGVLQFEDRVRADSRIFIQHLRPKHAVNRVIIVSGDRDAEVRRLARQVGIQEIHSAKSPEEKVAIVRAESERASTLFMGDGINDAPAMQAATVGVAFGAKNDITAEAADAVILETSLSRVDELMHIARRMRRIALQSALGGMALSLIGMAAAALGLLPAIAGAVAQELIDLAAVLNAVRVALSDGRLSDF